MSHTWRDLWDFEDPAGSEARLRESAARSTPGDAALLRTQVARALGLQDRYAEAHRELDDLSSGSGSPELEVRITLERGRLQRSSGDPAAARASFEAAARAAGRHGLDELRVDALHMLAMTERTPARQLAVLGVGLGLALASQDPRARDWEASLLNNIGMSQHEAGDLEAALVTFRRAVTARERTGRPREVRIARWMVAWTLRLLGQEAEALVMQRALAAELAAAGESDPFVDEELARLEPRSGDD